MPQKPAELRGMRILVVEDNFLVSEMLRDFLSQCGAEVVGPAPRVDAALQLCEQEGLDGALLDINLAGQEGFPVATRLLERGVPFMFLSGYDDVEMIPSGLRHIPRLAKPFDCNEVAEMAARHFGRGAVRNVCD